MSAPACEDDRPIWYSVSGRSMCAVPTCEDDLLGTQSQVGLCVQCLLVKMTYFPASIPTAGRERAERGKLIWQHQHPHVGQFKFCPSAQHRTEDGS